MLKITKNFEEANLVTHNGTFHTDDVFATMFMSKIISNPVVIRTGDVTNARSDAIIYDIGYGKFDHHGPDALMRDDKIKYCAFGLLWAEYGRDYLKTINEEDTEKLFKVIDENLIMQIDGIDNGLFPKVDAPYRLTDLDKVIDFFNKAWNEDVDNDDNFLKAVNIAEIIFDRIVLKENAKIVATKKVLEEMKNVRDGILILNEYMPYNEAIFSVENHGIKIVIFPSNRGGFNIKPVTVSKESRELVCNFPKAYWGLHDEELANISGIDTARFVHSTGFLGVTGTLDDAIKLANKAINNEEAQED